MSEIDKEAEREKLREQFEKEEEARKTTAHMSELLLKGATMTNKHCDTCGDPIFRYQGQTFCPTCQTPVNTETDGAGNEEPETINAPDSSTTGDESHAISASADQTDGSGETDSAATTAPSRPIPRDQSPETTPSSVSSRADLSDARDSLIVTLNSLTRRAETTDDVAQARELLRASKEAAEALRAVESLSR